MNQSTSKIEPACDATIAICTYNRLNLLKRTLQSLSYLRGPYSFEVLVVNGPSNDGTAEFLSDCKDIRVLDNSEVNLAISRNMAIANAAGKYIAFIDDDAIPEPTWLARMISAFESNDELSAVGGFIRDANGMAFQTKYVYCDDFGRELTSDTEFLAGAIGDLSQVFLSLTGTNVAFRLDDIRRVEGFDEVFAYFLDETDVNKRMTDAGMSSHVLPNAEIHHKYAASHLRTEKKLARNMYPISRSIAYYALKHAGKRAEWSEIAGYLKDFYSRELRYKTENLVLGDLTHEKYADLMFQVQRGILDGIDRYFETRHQAIEGRVGKHARPGGARVVRRMHAPEDTLRVCMLSQDHASANMGGIGRWTNLVARGLAEEGHEVTVIGQLPAEYAHEFCDFTTDCFWSHNVANFGREASRELDCLGLPAILANAAKRKFAEFQRIQPQREFQLVSSPIWDVEGAAFIGDGTLPNVLSLHTCAGKMLEYKPEWKADEAYYRGHVLRVINAEIHALRRCDLIMANSKAVLADISSLYDVDLAARPHVIIPHGIDDIEAPDGLLDQRMARNDPVRVLFLGRLETRKGVGPLVSVFETLLSAGKPVRLDIVGSRVDEANFKRVTGLVERFPDRVTYHGYLGDEAVDPLMRKADIFFAPSLYESFGLIFVEAMRYSLPSVSFAGGGISEVVEHGVDGLLASPGDERELCKHLEHLIGDPALRAGFSRQARQSFLAKFHYTTMARRIADAYRGALKTSDCPKAPVSRMRRSA